MDLHFSRSLLGFLAVGLAIAGALVGPAPEVRALEGSAQATVSPATAASAELAHHPRDKTYIKRRWGVELMGVRQTAAGYMLEFRYRVLDAEKAKALFERQTKPALTHTETGATLVVPTPAKTGALRNSNAPIEGRTYWMFFANPGQLVKSGQQVSIEIGEFRVDGLVVR